MCFNVRFINIAALDKYPTAGRVQVCSQNWAQITADPWILDKVQGYQLELESTPVQQSPPPGLPLSPQECNLVEREIEKLIQKGVSPVDPVQDHFISHIFVVPKKRRKISTSGEPEGLEQAHEAPPLQNGRCSSAERSPPERGLDGIHRSKGCVSISVSGTALQTSPEIHVGRATFPVSVPSIWTFHCPSTVYQGDETGDVFAVAT